ncbi:hypothetical protein Pelo_19311 [Pelomyxa schiedti]|nr:hypothetical protein Pelo_19311 [Pelomyxa schiedti]
MWVDDTRYLGSTLHKKAVECGDGGDGDGDGYGGEAVDVVAPMSFARWIMCNACDVGSLWPKRRDDGVVVCEEPVWFRRKYGANSKWLVLLGCGVGGGEKVHRFNDDSNKNRTGGFSHHKVPPEVISDGYTLESALLRFDGQRPDELLLFLLRKARSAESSIIVIVIDVEQTHSNGALCICSITPWSSPFVGALISAFVMRKKSGARCFICTAFISDPNTVRSYSGNQMRGIAVEEGTGRVTPLAPHAWFDPVSDSVFLIRDATCNNLLICDCNDPTSPSNVVMSTNSNCLDDEGPLHDRKLPVVGGD